MKVVYNACFGGFRLSNKATLRLIELGYKGLTPDIRYVEGSSPTSSTYTAYYGDDDIPRHHPLLVQVVEELGEEANGGAADLRIEEIEGFPYYIEDYDGMESVLTPEDWVTS